MTAPTNPDQTAGRTAIELGGGDGIPERVAADRWRTVWYDKGQRHQCEAATEDRLAARLVRPGDLVVATALWTTDGQTRSTLPGADLIAFYLSPGRLRVQRQPPGKHAHNQRWRCERIALPVIGGRSRDELPILILCCMGVTLLKLTMHPG